LDLNSMQAPPGNHFQADNSDHPLPPTEQTERDLKGVPGNRSEPEGLRHLLARVRCLSVYHHIVISITFILVTGVLVGTLITRYLVLRSFSLGWVLLATALAVAGSILVASWLARWVLRPLSDLQALVRQAQQAHTGIDIQQLASHDSQIRGLAEDVNAIIDELHQRNQQMRSLSKHAINAQEDERRRIARSLHDETGQSLAMLIISLERLEKQKHALDETAQAQLTTAHQLATQALASLRQIVHGLRPAILDDLGLAPAIRWYATTNLEAAGIRLRFDAAEEPVQLPARLRTTLFRIAQEGVNNIIRHAGARSAAITLKVTDKEVCLQIEDDGKGFWLDPDSGESQQEGHWGLAGIRERVSLVNGQVEILTEQGGGTLIQVTVPVDRDGGVEDE
jgi:signal transduction histidine kinase